MPDTNLEQALDELYAAEPGDFVSTRKQLTADMRAAGDKAGANLLKTARRPSTAAWALNQLARREPQLVEALIARSDELLAAQSRPQAGQLDSMQDAIRAHRRALADATDAALGMLGPRANDSFRNEIVSTLRAASTDAEVARELERGRVLREADSSSGFPDSTHLTIVPDPPPVAPAKKKPRGPDPSDAQAQATEPRAREQEREQQAARDAARASRDEALARAAEAAADVTRAEARVRELETQLDAARRDLRDARHRSRNEKATAARLTARSD